jgi:hypothetical protein
MPQQPSQLPATLGNAFTREAALRAGVSARRLRAKDLRSPYFRVRQRLESGGDDGTGGDLADAPLARDRAFRAHVWQLAQAYCLVMPRQAFFSGRTAAVLFGLPVAHGERIEVAIPAPARSPRGRGVRGVQVRPELVSLRDVDGLPVSSPASTWAMLARELSVRELVIVGDAILRIPRDDRGRPQPNLQLATIEHLRSAIDAGPRRGIGRLREAIEHVRVGSASPLESDYRLDAAAAGLPEPELDVEIRDMRGRLLGITELAYPAYRTLVEIEGDHHRTDKWQWDRDIEKYTAYAAEGWEVVRLTARHIRGENSRAVARVAAVLERRGWRT